MSKCQDIRKHHSDDTVTVYCGRPQPVTLCGFHANADMDARQWLESAGYAACGDERHEYMDGPTMVLRCSRREGHQNMHCDILAGTSWVGAK